MRRVFPAVVLGFALGCASEGPARRAPEPRVSPPAPPQAPPSREPPPDPVAPREAPEPGAYRCEVVRGDASARLREDLRQLSRAHWDEARRKAAEALCTIAVGLEAVSSPQPPTEAVRREAAKLADVERLPFTHSARVRAGLEAALEALDELAAAHRLEEARPWLTSARRSVVLVDPEGLFELQRAAIQEAFRTVSAAFTIVTQALPGASASRDRAPTE